MGIKSIFTLIISIITFIIMVLLLILGICEIYVINEKVSNLLELICSVIAAATFSLSIDIKIQRDSSNIKQTIIVTIYINY